MDIVQKLNKMKSILDNAEKQVNLLQGRLDGLYDQMKKEFGIEDLEEAEEKLLEMDTDLANKEKKLQEDVQKLEESYDWNL